MQIKSRLTIELFYTLGCQNCKVLQRMLDDVLPSFGDTFTVKRTLANGPVGYVRTLKLGVYAVPTLLIDNKIVFRSVPTKQELIEILHQYSNNKN
ncbi:MAG: thioredoxin family protein [Bacteroidales bacterium]|nr:thioredoxin family protein [Bacteroidales bacterium]